MIFSLILSFILNKEWIGESSTESPTRRPAGKRLGEETNFAPGKKARNGPEVATAEVESGAQVFAEISGYYDEDQEATYEEVREKE